MRRHNNTADHGDNINNINKNNKKKKKAHANNNNNNSAVSATTTLLQLSHALENFSPQNNSDFNPVRPVIHSSDDHHHNHHHNVSSSNENKNQRRNLAPMKDPLRLTTLVNSALANRISKASAYEEDIRNFVQSLSGNGGSGGSGSGSGSGGGGDHHHHHHHRNNSSDPSSHGHVIPARVPNLGTNIDDIRKKVDFHEYGTRYMLIGLNHECHAFLSLNDLLEHVQTEAGNHRTIKQFLNETESTVWIDIQNPSEKDIAVMEKNFGIHPLTTEDIMSQSASEKWETFAEYMFVVFQGQLDDENPVPQEVLNRNPNMSEIQLSLLVFRNYVLTIHEFPIKGLDTLMRRIEVEYELDLGRSKTEIEKLMHQYDEQRTAKRHAVATAKSSKVDVIRPNRSQNSLASPSSENLILLPDISIDHIMEDGTISNPQIITKTNILNTATTPTNPNDDDSRTIHPKCTTIPSSDWVLYAFLDAMVDMYIPNVNSLIFEVEHIDNMVYELEKEEREDLLKRIGLAKKNSVSLGRVLVPKRKITNDLIEQQCRFITTNVQFYLRDIIDHLEICLEKLDVARQNLVHAHHNYLTKVQMEIVESSGRTDAFMNRLSILALLFLPPTIIAGIFGMNVRVIGQGDHVDNLYPFFGILTAMTVLFLGTIILLRHQFV